MGTLQPREGDRPQFAQIYVVGGEGEADNRMSFFPDEPLRAGLVAALQAVLHRHNHWVRGFKQTALENPAVNVELTIRANGGPACTSAPGHDRYIFTTLAITHSLTGHSA